MYAAISATPFFFGINATNSETKIETVGTTDASGHNYINGTALVTTFFDGTTVVGTATYARNVTTYFDADNKQIGTSRTSDKKTIFFKIEENTNKEKTKEKQSAMIEVVCGKAKTIGSMEDNKWITTYSVTKEKGKFKVVGNAESIMEDGGEWKTIFKFNSTPTKVLSKTAEQTPKNSDALANQQVTQSAPKSNAITGLFWKKEQPKKKQPKKSSSKLLTDVSKKNNTNDSDYADIALTKISTIENPSGNTPPANEQTRDKGCCIRFC